MAGNDPARAQPSCDAVMELLFAVEPLRHLARGDRRKRLDQAFLRVAARFGGSAPGAAETVQPESPAAAARALIRAAVDIAAGLGVPRSELTAAFNDHLGTAHCQAPARAKTALVQLLAETVRRQDR